MIEVKGTVNIEGNYANAIESRYYDVFSSIYSLSSFEFTVTNIGQNSLPGTTTSTYIPIDIMIMNNTMYEKSFLPCVLEEKGNSNWVDIYGNKAFDKDCFDERKNIYGLIFDGRFNTLHYYIESSNLYPLNHPIKFTANDFPSDEDIYHIVTYSDELSESLFWCTFTFPVIPK